MRCMRLFVIAIIIFTLAISFSVPIHAKSTVKAGFADHMVGTTGNIAYYAVGIDGGGPLYRYNVKTKEKKLIATGKWESLSIKGKYIYASKNDYYGSDARNRSIYRISKDGKVKTKLANGYSPVVKGKYIYYFAVNKINWYGGKADGKVKGIYRMKLNGKSKKKMVGFRNAYQYGADHLSVIKGNKFLYCAYTNEWYISKKGSNKKKRYKGVVYANMTFMSYSNDFKSMTKVKVGGTVFSAKGKYLYAKGGTGKKKIAKVNGIIEKIIVSGKQILVITNSGTKYHVYLMSKNGKNLNRVSTGDYVSGGWGT